MALAEGGGAYCSLALFLQVRLGDVWSISKEPIAQFLGSSVVGMGCAVELIRERVHCVRVVANFWIVSVLESGNF